MGDIGYIYGYCLFFSFLTGALFGWVARGFDRKNDGKEERKTTKRI